MTPLHKPLALLTLACLLFFAQGCNIVAPVAILVAGDPKIEQQFALDPKRPTVIFVDDRGSRLPKRSLRAVIAEQAQQTLMSEKVLLNAIDTRAAYAATSGDRDGKPMSITAIARAAQAEVIIWVTIDSFTFSPDGQVYQPAIGMRVKVMDAVNDTRIWPAEKEGFKLTAMMKKKPNYAPSSQSDLAQAEIESAKWAGTAVAQLFYKHLVSESALTPK